MHLTATPISPDIFFGLILFNFNVWSVDFKETAKAIIYK